MKRLVIALALLCVAVNPAVGLAEDAAAPAMDPEMAAKMVAMEKFGAPGESHKRLESLVGKWKFTLTSQMTPEGPSEIMEGTSESRWILGGRFVQEDVKSDFHGKPFEGIGITGFDNVRGEYTSIWIDNVSTGAMISTGQYDAAQNSINQSGSFACPMTGEKNMSARSVLTLTDNDHHTYEMYTNDKDGKEFKNMTIISERVA